MVKPVYPSFTKEWRNDTYPAINPSRPELSLKGKKVVVTGGGAGIGRGITLAFAQAGVASIAILGRRRALLDETKIIVESKYPDVTVDAYISDICSLEDVKEAASKIGTWDILISNAGYIPEPRRLEETGQEQDWWKTFEINVKGAFNISHALLPNRNHDAIILSVNAGSIQVPLDFQKMTSAYNASKFAALRFFEILAAENPDVHIVSFHPGVVETDLYRKSKMQAPEMDSIELPSHFAVWLCSEEARFLRNRFVWCNWDVEELGSKKKEIVDNPLLFTGNCIGWPYV